MEGGQTSKVLRGIGRFLLCHPASSILGVALLCVMALWLRAGRYFDSVEFLTPKFIVTVHSEMRVLMITGVGHDDSSWEVYHNDDIATVDAPWAMAVWPKVWWVGDEMGLVIVDAQLALLLLVLLLSAYFLERRWLKRRENRIANGNQ